MLVDAKSPLSAAPGEVLDETGEPRLGTYGGSFERVDWNPRLEGIKGRLRGIARRKKWWWGSVSTPEVFVGFAIVDVGYASNAFAFAVDLKRGEKLADVAAIGRPWAPGKVDDRLGEGAGASFACPEGHLLLERRPGTEAFDVSIALNGLRLETRLDLVEAPPPLAVVMRLKEGDTTATQKLVLLPASGSLEAGGRRFELSGGFGGLDYSHGLLGRQTAWRWAFGLGTLADGRRVAFNLSDGLSLEPGAENALWVGGELVKVGPARFTWDAKNPEGPWQVRSECGTVQLRFSSRGMHQESRNLVLVRSRFFQVAGLFSGHLRVGGAEVPVVDLPGVTEDQFVVW